MRDEMIPMSNRILTTHVGSLPRPVDLLDRMKAKLSRQAVDDVAYEASIAQAVDDVVKTQRENGIDIVADGEMSKPGFFTYVQERLDGFEARQGAGPKPFAAEVAAFPEYYEDYFRRAMFGGTLAPVATMVCTGPVSYRGKQRCCGISRT